MTKALVIEQLKNFPEEFSIDELTERLIILERIQQSEKSFEEGNFCTSDELKDKIEEWVK